MESHAASYEYGAEMLRLAMWEGGVSPDGPAVASLLRECFLTERVAEVLLKIRSSGEDSASQSLEHLLVV